MAQPGASGDSLDAIRGAAAVRTIAEFKQWIRDEVRPILPHEALACGYGHLHAAGIAMDYVVTVDYPLEHLAAIRNRTGGIDTPIMRRWLQTGAPVLFDADAPWPEVSPQWLENFQRHRLRNAAAHAVYDQERCVGTYFSFHRLPGPLGAAHERTLVQITPHLHEVLLRVIHRLDRGEPAGASRLAALAPREREVASWIGQGKTNLDIAQLLSLSENTVKHHVTSILDKTGLFNRAQLVSLLTEENRHSQQRNGTKVL